MKGFTQITNAYLTESDLPLFTNKWDQPLMQFAMSFDGYRFMGSPTTQKLGSLANQAMKTYEKENWLPKSLKAFGRNERAAGFIPAGTRPVAGRPSLPPNTLNELRACLFFEGRRWHHVGSAVGGYEAFDKDGRAMRYIHALLEAIARKICDGERE
jgi:hypothetical protein